MADPWAVKSVEPVSDPWAVTDVKPIKASRPKLSPMQQATGFMANVNRGLGIGDEIAGGVQGAINAGGALMRGDVAGVPNAFASGMRQQRQVEDQFTADSPRMAALGRGVGNAGTMGAPIGPGVQALAAGSRALNMGRGAVIGGVTAAGYAAADRGTGAERLSAASQMASNPLALGLGAAGGALTPAARNTTRKPVKVGDVLGDVGVSTSIPQRMGRAAKGVEDLLKRFPITGQAMAGYQDRQIGQLNRAVGLKALAPIGEGIPKSVQPGFDMVQYVDDALGRIYSRAAKLAPRVTVDEQIVKDFQGIAARKADLPESEGRLFDSIMNDRLARLKDETASGEMVKSIHGELGGLQAEAAKKGQDTLARMIGDSRQALMGMVGRASPEAGRLIRRADEGWGVYSIMNDAAAAASARGGVFLPGQLNTQVRSSAKRMGSNMAGKGRGNLQDIATAASQTIPDSYGNPGTANATLLAGGGVGAVNDLGATVGAAAGLGAIATPYLMMGRKVLEALPENATRRELVEAAKRLQSMVANDPSVAPLLREVSGRLSRAAGSTTATSRQPSIEVSIEGRPERGLAYGR